METRWHLIFFINILIMIFTAPHSNWCNRSLSSPSPWHYSFKYQEPSSLPCWCSAPGKDYFLASYLESSSAPWTLHWFTLPGNAISYSYLHFYKTILFPPIWRLLSNTLQRIVKYPVSLHSDTVPQCPFYNILLHCLLVCWSSEEKGLAEAPNDKASLHWKLLFLYALILMWKGQAS